MLLLIFALNSLATEENMASRCIFEKEGAKIAIHESGDFSLAVDGKPDCPLKTLRAQNQLRSEGPAQIRFLLHRDCELGNALELKLRRDFTLAFKIKGRGWAGDADLLLLEDLANCSAENISEPLLLKAAARRKISR